MAEGGEIVKWGAWTVVWVDSSDVDTALDLARRGVVDGIGLSPYSGFVGEDISFLRDAPYLQGVVLPYAEKYDLTVLYSIPNLRFLTVAESRQTIDFGSFPMLEDLRIEWHAKVRLPQSGTPLQSIYLDGYKPKTKDLTQIPAYGELVDLGIVQGNMTNLSGVESFSNLESASLYYLRRLESVKALAEMNLEHLLIEGSKKITDLDSLSRCPNLKSLCLFGCGVLPSLKFLNEFPALEEFRFVNTTIEDGDMTPLLRLKSVGFLNKKGYSHTPEEIENEISGEK